LSFHWMRTCPWCGQSLKKVDPSQPWQCLCGWTTKKAQSGHHYGGLSVASPILLLILMLLDGCATPSFPPTSQDTRLQVVSDTRALVIGQDGKAVQHVIEGLQQVGFTIVNEARAPSLVGKHTRDIADSHEIHSNFYEADVLVVVQVSGLRAYPSVAVQGLDIQTGELLWSGDAVQLRGVGSEEYDRAVIQLTRRALFDGLSKPQ
jgi:hypothetical protein